MLRKFAQFMLSSFLASVLVTPAVAQRGGGFHGGMGGFHGGMGGFHGGMGGGFHGGMGGFHGGMGGGFRGGGYGGAGFRGGFVHPGFRGYRGYYPGNRFVFGFGYPYWPYYGAGWSYPYYGYPYYYPYSVYSYPDTYSYPNYDSGYAYAAPSPTSCPQANGKPLYLIKLTYANNVWVAQDYWYTADTLNFVTEHGEQNKTPAGSIDRAATFQLNHDCGVNFQLPK
jgi:hypothetical protein